MAQCFYCFKKMFIKSMVMHDFSKYLSQISPLYSNHPIIENLINISNKLHLIADTITLLSYKPWWNSGIAHTVVGALIGSFFSLFPQLLRTRKERKRAIAAALSSLKAIKIHLRSLNKDHFAKHSINSMRLAYLINNLDDLIKPYKSIEELESEIQGLSPDEKHSRVTRLIEDNMDCNTKHSFDYTAIKQAIDRLNRLSENQQIFICKYLWDHKDFFEGSKLKIYSEINLSYINLLPEKLDFIGPKHTAGIDMIMRLPLQLNQVNQIFSAWRSEVERYKQNPERFLYKEIEFINHFLKFSEPIREIGYKKTIESIDQIIKILKKI